VLQSIRPLVRENLAVGQYSGKGDAGQPGSKLGYLDDPSLQNKDSCTETFAAAVLHVHNPRWDGVPFVLKAGKALSDKKCEVRIHAVPNPNPDPDPSPSPNPSPNPNQVRIQFHAVPGVVGALSHCNPMYPELQPCTPRAATICTPSCNPIGALSHCTGNELVVRLQPEESIYWKARTHPRAAARGT